MAASITQPRTQLVRHHSTSCWHRTHRTAITVAESIQPSELNEIVVCLELCALEILIAVRILTLPRKRSVIDMITNH
jgi:hypothetical protein